MATGDGPTEDQDERELVSLEGRAVRFTWDEEEEGHSCAFLDEGEDEAPHAVLLGDQRTDAFGGWFLPPPGTWRSRPAIAGSHEGALERLPQDGR